MASMSSSLTATTHLTDVSSNESASGVAPAAPPLDGVSQFSRTVKKICPQACKSKASIRNFMLNPSNFRALWKYADEMMKCGERSFKEEKWNRAYRKMKMAHVSYGYIIAHVRNLSKAEEDIIQEQARKAYKIKVMAKETLQYKKDLKDAKDEENKLNMIMKDTFRKNAHVEAVNKSSTMMSINTAVQDLFDSSGEEDESNILVDDVKSVDSADLLEMSNRQASGDLRGMRLHKIRSAMSIGMDKIKTNWNDGLSAIFPTKASSSTNINPLNGENNGKHRDNNSHELSMDSVSNVETQNLSLDSEMIPIHKMRQGPMPWEEKHSPLTFTVSLAKIPHSEPESPKKKGAKGKSKKSNETKAEQNGDVFHAIVPFSDTSFADMPIAKEVKCAIERSHSSLKKAPNMGPKDAPWLRDDTSVSRASTLKLPPGKDPRQLLGEMLNRDTLAGWEPFEELRRQQLKNRRDAMDARKVKLKPIPEEVEAEPVKEEKPKKSTKPDIQSVGLVKINSKRKMHYKEFEQKKAQNEGVFQKFSETKDTALVTQNSAEGPGCFLQGKSYNQSVTKSSTYSKAVVHRNVATPQPSVNTLLSKDDGPRQREPIKTYFAEEPKRESIFGLGERNNLNIQAQGDDESCEEEEDDLSQLKSVNIDDLMCNFLN